MTPPLVIILIDSWYNRHQMVQIFEILTQIQLSVTAIDPAYQMKDFRMKHFGILVIYLVLFFSIQVTVYQFLSFVNVPLAYFLFMYTVKLIAFCLITEMMQNRLRFLKEQTTVAKPKLPALLAEMYDQILEVTEVVNQCFSMTFLLMVVTFEVAALQVIYGLFKFVSSKNSENMEIFWGIVAGVLFICLIWITIADCAEGCFLLVG